MPFESMAKVTSICGTPRGAGGMPTSSNRPSERFSRANSPLALEHVDLHRVLVVDDGGEDLACSWSGWSSCASISLVNRPPWVSMPSDSGVTSSSTRSLMSPLEDAALDRRAHRHHLVRVDLAVGLAAEDALRPVSATSGVRVWPPTSSTSSIWSARRPASRRRVAARRLGALDQVARPAPRSALRVRVRDEVAGAGVVGGDERQVDLASSLGRQLALGALGGLLEALQRHAVVAQVDAGLALRTRSISQSMIRLVEVLAAEVGVAGGGADLEDPLGELEDRDVEGAAAEVVDGHDPLVAGAARGRRRARPRSAR